MSKLVFTIDEQQSAEVGVPLADFIAALDGVQDAMRLMVEHLGGRQHGQGRPPDWVRDQSALRLTGTRPGSFVAELVREPPSTGQAYLEDYGGQALDALQHWNGERGSTLPDAVTGRLFDMAAALSEGARVWLGNADDHRRVEVRRAAYPPRTRSDLEPALLHGWLREVNWDKHTAQLHQNDREYMTLQFDQSLDEEMRRLAKQYVEVRGDGQLAAGGSWRRIRVQTIAGTRSWRTPFDPEAFLNNPNRKIFDPDSIVTASEPFDVDEFVRTIREGRDAGREAPPQ